MRKFEHLRRLQLQLKVNGVPIALVRLRQVSIRPSNRLCEAELVIHDNQCGAFALHEDFVLELKRADEDPGEWRRISLEDLKQAVAEAITRSCLEPLPDLDEHDRAQGCGPNQGMHSLTQTTVPVVLGGEGDYMRHALAVLYQHRVPYLVTNYQSRQGPRPALLEVLVARSLGARMALRQAGFRQSTNSRTLWFTPDDTGVVCLIAADSPTEED